MKFNRNFIRKFKGMPKISYGRCIRSGCVSVSDLADGLCMNCWDRTSYKYDLDKESKGCIEEIEEAETLSGLKGTGNKSHTNNFLY